MSGEWQPIETAPDGDEPILLFGVTDGEISGKSHAPVAAVGSRYGSTWSLDEADYYLVMIYATHWMPLPEPPK